MHFNAHFSYFFMYYGGVHSWCVNYVCNDLSGLNLRFLFCFYLVRNSIS